MLVHDPLVDPRDAARACGVALVGFDALRRLDALILAVPHRTIRDRNPAELTGCVLPGGVLVDIKGILPREAVPPRMNYWRL